ncbi:hypothetical protein KJ359_001691 [Pestalotiopsis sp. 9143b]|nr:hypothetical protein KJ359_001691 [Pestalotiopsis sp. 9143b]
MANPTAGTLDMELTDPSTASTSGEQQTQVQSPPMTQFHPHYVHMIAPRVEDHPQFKFDGKEATYHLKRLKRFFDSYAMTDQDMLRELPYWSISEVMEDRVRTSIDGCRTRNDAEAKIKSTFRIGDSKQGRTLGDRLRDLERGDPIKDPEEVHCYCLDHEARVLELREAGQEPSDSDKTRGLLERIDRDAMRSILMQYSIKDYDELFGREYFDVSNMLKQWADTEVKINKHHVRANYSRPVKVSDKREPANPQSSTGASTSPPNTTAGTTIQDPEVDDMTKLMRNLVLSVVKASKEGKGGFDQAEEPYYPMANAISTVPVMDPNSFKRFPIYRSTPSSQNRRPGGNRSTGTAPVVCHFCGRNHYVRECQERHMYYEDKFSMFDNGAQEYFYMTDQGRASDMALPSQLVDQCRQRREHIGLAAAAHMLHHKDDFPPATVTKAKYYLTRNNIGIDSTAMDNRVKAMENSNNEAAKARAPITSVVASDQLVSFPNRSEMEEYRYWELPEGGLNPDVLDPAGSDQFEKQLAEVYNLSRKRKIARTHEPDRSDDSEVIFDTPQVGSDVLSSRTAANDTATPEAGQPTATPSSTNDQGTSNKNESNSRPKSRSAQPASGNHANAKQEFFNEKMKEFLNKSLSIPCSP